MSIEGFLKTEKVKISFEELQEFFNREEWDLPERNRDLSISRNVGWINRNFGVRNKMKPKDMKYWEALKKLMKANHRGIKYEDI